MNKYLIASLLFISSLLTSCTEPPKIEVKNVLDLKKQIDANEVVIVTDVGRNYGENFRKVFMDKLTGLTQLRNKKISIMSYIEFVRSPYNNPKEKASFPDTLFVFIRVRGILYNYSVEYLLEVKHLDQEPFFIQAITLKIGYGLADLTEPRADELTNAIFKELCTRNIL